MPITKTSKHDNIDSTVPAGTVSSQLVAQAVFQNPSVSTELHSDDVHMVMNLAMLIDTMTRSQRENLARVLNLCVKCTTRQLLEGLEDVPEKKGKTFLSRPTGQSTSWNIPVPSSKETLRAIFVEGKNSIKENIQHPMVRMDVPGHAYILPSECLADAILCGILDYNVTGKDSPYVLLPDSIKASLLAATDLSKRTIYLSLWSDDFEPNYSTKAGRGSVWLLTLTLESHESGPAGIPHVYPIAVGLKSEDHNNVLECILNDVKHLKAGISVFNGFKKSTDKLQCEVIAWTMDQPENRTINGLLGGNSTTFARFGYACDISKIFDKIRPCRTCHAKMLSVKCENQWNDRDSCNICNNWMAHGVMDYDPPKNYPEEKLNNGKVEPLILTYEFLKKECLYVHNKITSNTWTEENAMAYLKSIGLNDKSCKSLIRNASNMKNLTEAEKALEEEDNEENRLLVESVHELKEENPTEFEPWRHPAVWNAGIELTQCHQAGMHLLFLGVVKSMITVVSDWATKQKKNTALRESMRQTMDLLDGIHVSWLKQQPFIGGGLGGWVSENYMAFLRVLPWVYAGFDELPEMEYVQPTEPRSKWTANQCRDWLRSRQLSDKGPKKPFETCKGKLGNGRAANKNRSWK